MNRASVKFNLILLLPFILITCRKLESPENLGDFASDIVKINIEKDGLYRVTKQELDNAGLALEKIDAASLHLSQAGTAVPYLIDDEAILFYGQASDSRYTNMRTYLLEAGKAGVLMEETAVPDIQSPVVTYIPQSIHLEENHIYSTESREDDSTDVWYWQKLRQQESFPIEFNLPAISDQPATLRINQWGFTHNPQVDNDHDLDIIINDQKIETAQWDGQIHHTTSTIIPAGNLQSGANSLILDNTPEGASFLDTVQINWIELTYSAPPEAVSDYLEFSSVEGIVNLTGFSVEPKLFDITEKGKPKLLTSWQFNNKQAQLPVVKEISIAASGPDGWRSPASMTPYRRSNWNNPENQADLLIVTTDQLAPGLQPLVNAREEEGIETAVVPVAEIYDAFGFGIESPESIQNFVRYAYENWQAPKPAYLFIVGEATSDFHNYLGLSPANIVPPMLVPVGFSGETTSDTRLADINGDFIPELAVGRWPVDNIADVEALVKRTLAYEQGTVSAQSVFAADGTESYFTPMASRIGAEGNLPGDHLTVLEGPSSGEVTAALNNGAWLATYVGHGSLAQWGKDDVFTMEAVANLENATPPIVLQLTCLSGLFSHPQETSLSEAMLLQDGGPVLLVAATSLTLSTHQEPFAINLLQGLVDPSIIRIGDAFQAAKHSLDINNNSLREISDTFSLFGDPSTKILRP